ncbi:uncharacterized protein LY89DRAFT_673520 [Mollisia scopiformis]|uniref:Uncharacterized protein n=1 Tax=Mollisia scopiformis TaxID=149040 RepID=A0A194WY82_MOLSC|nr:uncharacterized protein LY89DRAFT_673520 [Mollisia scopiformis]KUJ12562.1 hypothetical protein LY89DRAFT_673520 [Mollisia scopiformis]
MASTNKPSFSKTKPRFAQYQLRETIKAIRPVEMRTAITKLCMQMPEAAKLLSSLLFLPPPIVSSPTFKIRHFTSVPSSRRKTVAAKAVRNYGTVLQGSRPAEMDLMESVEVCEEVLEIKTPRLASPSKYQPRPIPRSVSSISETQVFSTATSRPSSQKVTSQESAKVHHLSLNYRTPPSLSASLSSATGIDTSSKRSKPSPRKVMARIAAKEGVRYPTVSELEESLKRKWSPAPHCDRADSDESDCWSKEKRMERARKFNAGSEFGLKN